MFASIWIAVTIAWAAIVADVVAETAGADRGIVAFGTLLAQPGRAVTVVVLGGLIASAVLGMTLAIGDGWLRRRDRRLAATLDARFRRLAEEEARAAVRREQLEGRLAELHRRIESLARERQAIEDVLSRERRRAMQMLSLNQRLTKEIDEAARSLDDGMLTIPEVESFDRPA